MAQQGSTKHNIMLLMISIGLILIVVGTLLPLLQHSVSNPLYRYIYAVGAAMTMIGRLFTPYKGKVLRIKRLYRIEAWTSIIFCVAAFFMFYQPYTRDWIAFTMAGGILLVFTSIRIPQLVAKAQKEGMAQEESEENSGISNSKKNRK